MGPAAAEARGVCGDCTFFRPPWRGLRGLAVPAGSSGLVAVAVAVASSALVDAALRLFKHETRDHQDPGVIEIPSGVSDQTIRLLLLVPTGRLVSTRLATKSPLSTPTPRTFISFLTVMQIENQEK